MYWRRARISGGGTNEGRSSPISASRAIHCESSLPVFGRPGRFRAREAFTSCTFSPAASRVTNHTRQQPLALSIETSPAPASFSWPASSSIPGTAAPVSQAFEDRLPFPPSGGSRRHTIPDALAMPIPATRSCRSWQSSSSASRALIRFFFCGFCFRAATPASCP